MSYELSFAPEFFLAEGEPYDRSDMVLNKHNNPISVWSAITHMKETFKEDWATMAREVFDCEPEFLTEESVLDKIQETNTCSNLDTPVSVWIDEDGCYTVDVWDQR